MTSELTKDNLSATAPQPDVGLIAIARQELLDCVLPTLAGQARYSALMIANAMGISLREAESKEHGATVVPESARRLCEDIRAGKHDSGCDSYQLLLKSQRIVSLNKLAISNPKRWNAMADNDS